MNNANEIAMYNYNLNEFKEMGKPWFNTSLAAGMQVVPDTTRASGSDDL